MPANVKLTWTDTSNNELQFRVYRNVGHITQAQMQLVDDAAATLTGGLPANTNALGVAISPRVDGEHADLQSAPESTEQTTQGRLISFVDPDVPDGQWSYAVSAWNAAGETPCSTPGEIPVTVE